MWLHRQEGSASGHSSGLRRVLNRLRPSISLEICRAEVSTFSDRPVTESKELLAITQRLEAKRTAFALALRTAVGIDHE